MPEIKPAVANDGGLFCRPLICHSGAMPTGPAYGRPDDRLREAIQGLRKLDCFVATLLAMTLESGRFSQKTLRIDIDLELEIALCLWPRREPFA
jgi:hypothetical protein